MFAKANYLGILTNFLRIFRFTFFVAAPIVMIIGFPIALTARLNGNIITLIIRFAPLQINFHTEKRTLTILLPIIRLYNAKPSTELMIP